MCNAWNHSSDCPCGFGGEGQWGDGGGSSSNYTNNAPSTLQRAVASLTSYRYEKEDFCRPTTCKCGAEVFFIRHNGGCVWVEELGWPWPKHECEFINNEDGEYQFLANLGSHYEKAVVKPVLGRVIKLIHRIFDLVHLIAMENGQMVAVSGSRYVKPFTNLVAIRRTHNKTFLEDGRNSISVTDCKLASKPLADYLSSPQMFLYVGIQPSGIKSPKLKKKKNRKW